MLSIEDITKILGETKVREIEQELSMKNINRETTNRVLDYLALHKKCFPYLDNVELSKNLINNLQTNIVFHDAVKSLKLHRRNSGYTDGKNIAVSAKRITGIFRPKKILEENLDHVIRHELEHVAMAKCTQLDSNKKIEEYIQQNFQKASEVFGVEKPSDVQPFIWEQKERMKNGPAVSITTGVAGRPNSPFEFGSTPLNEGITEMKINIMDEQANRDGYIFKSGYNRLEVKIAKHMSKVIGEKQFLRMHQDGDFAGITKQYQETMGRDCEYMREFYLELDKPHEIPIEQKLFGNIGRQIGESLRSVLNNYKTSSQQNSGSGFVKSFLE